MMRGAHAPRVRIFGAVAEIILEDKKGFSKSPRSRWRDRQHARRVRSPKRELNRAGFFQRFVSAVFVDRLQSARGDANADEFFQLRHPDPMLVQVRREQTRHHFGDVPADAALFLGHTAAANNTAARGLRSGDGANFRHGAETGAQKIAARGWIVKRFNHEYTPIDTNDVTTWSLVLIRVY